MPTQQTQNICITFIQCWPNVFDVGPTLYKCHINVLCLLGRINKSNETYQSKEDENQLKDISVGHGYDLSKHGVDDCYTGGEQNSRIYVQIYDNTQTSSWYKV